MDRTPFLFYFVMLFDESQGRSPSTLSGFSCVMMSISSTENPQSSMASINIISPSTGYSFPDCPRSVAMKQFSTPASRMVWAIYSAVTWLIPISNQSFSKITPFLQAVTEHRQELWCRSSLDELIQCGHHVLWRHYIQQWIRRC